jgi:type IV secretion system protein VirB8
MANNPGHHGLNKKQELELYFREARSWETSKVIEAAKRGRASDRRAAIATTIAVIALIAVFLLLPLKSVEPYVIRVDNSTGIVDIVNALQDGKTNYDEALNKFFAQKYLRYREGFSKDLAEEYYYNVGLMSNSAEQQRFYAYFNPKNPISPLNVYAQGAKVKVDVRGTSFITPNVALVRYTKIVERGGSEKPQVSHWTATITFRYSKAPMSEKDREISPLGFQVTEYRNDPDSLPMDMTTMPVSAVAPAPAPTVALFPTVDVNAMPPPAAGEVPADNSNGIPVDVQFPQEIQ